jgi:hypothetical protein
MTAHLHKQLLPEDVIKEVLKDVFGTSTETGLIHASDKEFDAKLQLLKNRWDLLEKPYKTCPVVFRWFKLHVSPIIRENVRSELLRDLGMEEEKYTQNNSESLNALVKRYVNFQKQDILQFVNDLEECVLEQQNEVSKAAIGLGRWSLSSRYSHISKKANNWFSSMSQTEKENTLSSLCAASVSNDRESCDEPSVSRGGVANQEISPSVSRADVANEGKLSVPLTLVGDVFSGVISDGQLRAMWTKASSLLSEKKVIRAPDSNPKTRWIASDTASSPHVVTTSKANPRRYVCDKQCVGWKSHNICAHTIAAAEDNNELEGFLVWLASSNGKAANLTSAVYHGTYKHAGLKKPTRRKYGDVHHRVPLQHKVDRLPLSDVSNSQCNASQSSQESDVSGAEFYQSQPAAGCSTAKHQTGTAMGKSGGHSQVKDICSAGALNTVQYCSAAHNVGTVNIGALTSQAAPVPSSHRYHFQRSFSLLV